MSPVDKLIGQRIARLREHEGFSQAELAEKVSVAPETISRYESGKLSAPVARLADIAKAFRLRLEDLVRVPSNNVAHDRAIERLLIFAGPLTPDEIELVMDVAGPAVKVVQRAKDSRVG